MLFLTGALSFKGLDLGAIFRQAPEVEEGRIVCEATVTPDWDPNAYDIDNVGTAFTESNNIYRKVGDKSWSSFTQGTAIQNLEPFETYEYVFGISSTDFTDNAYGPHGFIKIPCKEMTATDTALYDDSVETEITATYYNADDNAAAETFTAGQVQTVSLKLSAGSENYFGNPYIADDSTMSNLGSHRKRYPNVLCLGLNSTAWEKPQKVYLATGEEMNSVAAPGIATVATGKINYCYELPVITDTVTRVYLKLEADGTTAPLVDDTAYLYAGGYYLTDSGDVAWGPETDKQAFVGTDAADTVTLDFT